MIRNLLATTAVAALISTGALAQTTTPAPMPQDPATTQPAAPMAVKADGNLASRIIGETVYNGTGDDAENIGEVNDIVIGADGGVEAVVIGVGGFLGIGEKDVAIEYDLVEWAERDGERWIVVETTADALKAQQEFDRLAYQPMPADADVAETKPATKEDLANAPVTDDAADAPADNVAVVPADDAATEAPANDMAAAPADDAVTEAPANDVAEAPAADATDQTQTSAIDKSTLTTLDTEGLRAEDFIGTTVYGANDENIGEVGDVALTEDGKTDAVILDVGGFLGIGEKEVAIGMDQLVFLTDEDGDKYLYTAFTQEQLEAQPAYEKDSYAERRDEMRLVVPN